MDRISLSALRKRAATLIVAGLGASAATAVSLTMALYEAANPRQPPVVAAGQPIDTGRWTVVLRDARFERSADQVRPDRLAVAMELTNLSSATTNAHGRLVALDGGPDGLPAPVFYLARDEAILFSLHPGMPERVVARWEWPGGVPVPSQVRLTVASQVHKQRDNLYGAPGWFDGPPAAVLTLAIDGSEAP